MGGFTVPCRAAVTHHARACSTPVAIEKREELEVEEAGKPLAARAPPTAAGAAGAAELSVVRRRREGA